MRLYWIISERLKCSSGVEPATPVWYPKLKMTKKAANKTTPADGVNNPMNARSVWLLLVDTTTRLFVPSVGGTVLGLWVDKKTDNTPLFTILGVTLGTTIALWLVYMQLREAERRSGVKS